ncbi:MAG: hypothetical protein IT355_15420 [Gemmatimonadaceae bacterium]|nr:hypothetical protein [Gemmatimonadaceae bacterium]
MTGPLAGAGRDTAHTQRASRRATLLTLGVLAVLVALVVLLTPMSDDGDDTRLTTLKYGPGNARLAADLLRRLGWRTRVSTAPLRGPLDTTVIYAVFDGPTPMRGPERAAVLAAVRRGAGLLVSKSEGESFALLDSLGLRTQAAGLAEVHPLGSCPVETDPLAVLRVRTRMMTFDTSRTVRRGTRTVVPYPSNATPLLSSAVVHRGPFDAGDETDDGASATSDDPTTSGADPRPAAPRSPMREPAPDTTLLPTVLAFPLGAGRVVALADPDVLRTDQVRNCASGDALAVVRAAEYLSADRRREIVFVEYYQSESGDGPGVVMGEWLRGAAAGRMTLTLLGACLVLLLARGRRTLAPVYRVREERRSALEHVDALATAWRTVRGTRTVARMLARGIRRRHAAGRWRMLDDAQFLSALAERHPSIAGQTAQLTAALAVPPSPADLPALRRAAAQIDAECLAP